MTARRLLLATLAASVLPACIAHLPKEPPRRVLDLHREIAVRAVSEPPGLPVYELREDGSPGRLLGKTPVVVGSLDVGKEIWKHGDEWPAPPATGAQSLVTERVPRRAGARPAPGGAGSIPFGIAVGHDDGSPPEPLHFEIPRDLLPRAFTAGHIDLDVGRVPSGAPLPRDLRPEPASSPSPSSPEADALK